MESRHKNSKAGLYPALTISSLPDKVKQSPSREENGKRNALNLCPGISSIRTKDEEDT